MPAIPVDLASLEGVLRALRHAGVPIGPNESHRIHHALGLHDTLDLDALRHVLTAALAKTVEHRWAIDRILDAWRRESERVLRPPRERDPVDTRDLEVEEPDSDEPVPRRPLRERLRRHRRAILLTAALGVLSTAAVLGWRATSKPPPAPPPRDPRPTPTQVPLPPTRLPETPPPEAFDPTKDKPPPLPFPERCHTWRVAEVTIEGPAAVSTWRAWITGGGLALLALGGLSLLELRYRRHERAPRHTGPPSPGATQRVLAAPTAPGPLFLGGDERRQMIWSVERFVGDEDRTALDVPRTVDRTVAAGGLPELCWRRASFPREVWIWRDTAHDEGRVVALAGELEAALARSGLAVRVGTFSDHPLVVCWKDGGEEFHPRVQDGHRDHVILVILTTGRGLVSLIDRPHEGSDLAALFRQLARWPRVALVDFSQDARRLLGFASRFGSGVEHVAPDDLAQWIGRGRVTPATVQRRREEFPRTLAAGVALAPRGMVMNLGTLESLRRALGVEMSAHTAQASALLGIPARAFDEHRRFLVTCEDCWDGAPVRGTVLKRSVTYWRQALDAAAASLAREASPFEPFENSEMARRVTLERALLDLYSNPERAANDLATLEGGSLDGEIRERLADLVPRDWPTTRGVGVAGVAVPLPWPESELSPMARLILRRLGLGAHVAPGALRVFRPRRLRVAQALCLGVLLASVALPFLDRTPVPGAPTILQEGAEVFASDTFQSITLRDVRRRSDGTYDIVAGDPRRLELVATEVPAGSVVRISGWTWEERAAREGLPGTQSQLWIAGRIPERIRGFPSLLPRRCLAALAFDVGNPDAQDLVAELLDRACADVVLVGVDALEHLEALRRADLRDGVERPVGHTGFGTTDEDQLLIIVPPGSPSPDLRAFGERRVVVAPQDLARLTTALDFERDFPRHIRPVSEVWPTAVAPVVAGGAASVRLRTGAAQFREPRTPGESASSEHAFVFVEVGPGTFLMGSPLGDLKLEGDSKAWNNEIPQHVVVVDGIEMTRDEITVAQYSGAGDDRLPQVDVKWLDIQEWVKKRAFLVPPEDVWEYAARGGTTTRFLSGPDAAALRYYAWYSPGSLQAVGQRAPNGLGLRDVFGNALEWTGSRWEENYDKRVRPPPWHARVEEPLASVADAPRVVRGGSCRNEARYLRSADRIRYEDWIRYVYLGFRCVRSPRRQHLVP